MSQSRRSMCWFQNIQRKMMCSFHKPRHPPQEAVVNSHTHFPFQLGDRQRLCEIYWPVSGTNFLVTLSNPTNKITILIKSQNFLEFKQWVQLLAEPEFCSWKEVFSVSRLMEESCKYSIPDSCLFSSSFEGHATFLQGSPLHSWTVQTIRRFL